MALKQGVVAHLFCGQKMVLILRNNFDGNVVDAGCWDSLTETMEPEDEGDFEAAMRRGFLEELGFIPVVHQFLGVTKAGHGFFCVFLREEEVSEIRINPEEGETFGLFNLHEIVRWRLGGAVRYHYEAYSEVFHRMAKGELPEPWELGLKVPVPA